jgi:alpha-N-arabinofuranosidase
MKKLTMTIGCLILSGLLSVNLMSQGNAVIKIDFDRRIGTVDRNIYGAFVEPIRNVVYGSIYDPASPFADENGFRKDFVQLVRELKIPVVRWPGGNTYQDITGKMASARRNTRRPRLDLAWHPG